MKKIILALILSVFYIIGTSQDSVVEKIVDVKPGSLSTFTELKIYPNPSKQEKVTIESSTNNITEISIANITGKQIFKKNYQFPETKSEIELSDVPNGIYLVKIRTDGNKIVARKLIVAKE